MLPPIKIATQLICKLSPNSDSVGTVNRLCRL